MLFGLILEGFLFMGVEKSTFSALSWMCCSGSFRKDELAQDRGLLKVLCHAVLLWAVNSLYVPLMHYNEFNIDHVVIKFNFIDFGFTITFNVPIFVVFSHLILYVFKSISHQLISCLTPCEVGC